MVKWKLFITIRRSFLFVINYTIIAWLKNYNYRVNYKYNYVKNDSFVSGVN